MDPSLRQAFHEVSFDLLLAQLMHAGDRESWVRESRALEAWFLVARRYAEALANDSSRRAHLAVVTTLSVDTPASGIRLRVWDRVSDVEREGVLPVCCPSCQADLTVGFGLRGFLLVRCSQLIAVTEGEQPGEYVPSRSTPEEGADRGRVEQVQCRHCGHDLL